MVYCCSGTPLSPPLPPPPPPPPLSLSLLQEQLQELSQLAQDVVKIDKYRAETCSVLGWLLSILLSITHQTSSHSHDCVSTVYTAGNFYSLRGDHDKAIAYFRRAIRLNEVDHSAWILLGHEFLEKKNCCMALEAYSRGVGESPPAQDLFTPIRLPWPPSCVCNCMFIYNYILVDFTFVL